MGLCLCPTLFLDETENLDNHPRTEVELCCWFWTSRLRAVFEETRRALLRGNQPRLELHSLMVTPNLPFESGTEILGSERLTGPLLDRITHRVHIIGANGEGYRPRQAKKRASRQSGHSKLGA